MNFCQTITKLMDDRGITAYKMWKDTAISQSIIGKWRSGEKEPTAAYLEKVADYFDVTTDFLLGNEKMPATENGDRQKRESEFLDIMKLLPPDEWQLVRDLAIKLSRMQ